MPDRIFRLPTIVLPASTEDFIVLIFWGLLITVTFILALTKLALPLLATWVRRARYNTGLSQLEYETQKATQKSRIDAENEWGAKMLAAAKGVDPADLEELFAHRVSKEVMADIVLGWKKHLSAGSGYEGVTLTLPDYAELWHEQAHPVQE